MDLSLFLSELPLKLRQAVIDNLPEDCQPDDCDSSCIKTYFCDDSVAFPTDEQCPASVIVTFKGFGRNYDKSGCSYTQYVDFHIRYLTGCFGLDVEGCDIDEDVSSVIACGYFFNCAIDGITPQQLGVAPGGRLGGPCNDVKVIDTISCVLEGGCAGFETKVRIYL